jgi:hypothetical protein
MTLKEQMAKLDDIELPVVDENEDDLGETSDPESKALTITNNPVEK